MGLLLEKVEGCHWPSFQNAFAFWPGLVSCSLAPSLRGVHQQAKTRLKSVEIRILLMI